MNKRGIESEISVWWILAIAVMVIIFLLIVDIKEAWGGAVGYLKNFLRFGR